MKKIILLIFVFLFVFTVPTFAFFGLFESAISSQTPQPMYRVPNGEEIEYMAKTIKQVQLLIDQIDKLKRMEEQGLDSQALQAKMLGNSKLSGIIGNDISSLTADDWENIIWDKINDLFTDLNNTVENIEELPEKTKNEIKNDVEDRVISPVDTTIEDLRDQVEEGNVKTYTLKEREKIFKEKVKELEEKLNITAEYYVKIDQKYGEKSKFENYINKEEETLSNLSMKLENNLENASLPMTLKSLNVLILQNNRINLKTLRAISDLNEQIGRIGEIYNKENIGNEFKNIDRRFNN